MADTSSADAGFRVPVGVLSWAAGACAQVARTLEGGPGAGVAAGAAVGSPSAAAAYERLCAADDLVRARAVVRLGDAAALLRDAERHYASTDAGILGEGGTRSVAR